MLGSSYVAAQLAASEESKLEKNLLHQDSNPRPSGLYHIALTIYATTCPAYGLRNIWRCSFEPISSKPSASSIDIDISKRHLYRIRDPVEDISYIMSSCIEADRVRSAQIPDRVKAAFVYCFLQLEHLDHGLEYHWEDGCISDLHLNLCCPV
jgi:hypothetical protein